MSWKPEVITRAGGVWAGNALRFATQREAKDYVADLMMRWSSVIDTRVIETNDPVSYIWSSVEGALPKALVDAGKPAKP
jgi:hypothetical protein